MAPIARVLCVARRGLCRYQAPSPHSSAAGASPLLVKLLQQPDAGVRLALDSESHRDAAFWEPLVAALAASSPRKAELVLEWRVEKLLNDDARDREQYCKFISLCAKVGSVPPAMRAFAAMESQGIRLGTGVFNALVSACLSTRDFVMGLSLFEIMERSEDCKPDLATYSAFVDMYSNLGDDSGMMAWYSAAKRAGFSPNVRMYESMIAGFVRLGRFDDADRVYEGMVSADVLPNVGILEWVLEGLCKQKDVSRIKVFVKFMLDGGWELNGTMVEKLVALYTEMNLVQQMEDLLGCMNPSIGSSVLYLVHWRIVRLYALLDRVDDMEHAVGRMMMMNIARAATIGVAEDVEAVICCYFRRKAFQRLDLFLDRIRGGSSELPRSTYDLLVAGYRRFELNERLNWVIQDMKRAGFA